jgi:hypothetical protein
MIRIKNFFQLLALLATFSGCNPSSELQVAYFQADVTPEIGIPVAYAPTRSVTDSLSARGIVLVPAGQKPIVLLSVDWLAVSNESMQQFKEYLASAAKTTSDRVTVHTVHQHDTPWADASSEKILAAHGLGGKQFDLSFLDQSMKRTANALSSALLNLKPVKSIGTGQAKVDKVASNRRILGEDGKVKIVRFSSARDSAAIQAPEGLIDPFLKSVSFWGEDDRPLVTLNYYATHPQSYYGKGDVNPEFIGLARNAVHKKTGVPQIFFIGAAGNIAAGKYNNGAPETRPILTGRIATAIEKAFENAKLVPVPSAIKWRSEPLDLPIADHLQADTLKVIIADTTKTYNERFVAVRQLAWLEQNTNGSPMNVTSLQLGDTWLLHLPGEPFVEYQLAAQKLKPNGTVCTAAYGEDGILYIGTEISYQQGGYEVDKRVNLTTPQAEQILTSTIQKVLP